jgi:hypothetical protein
MTTCTLCGSDGPIETAEYCTGYLAASPDGDVLELPYGEWCEDCWSRTLESWERRGERNKPLSAYR